MESAVRAEEPDAVSEMPFGSAELHAEVRAFLDREAELIDGRQFAAWLSLVTDDFAYRMPVPLTPDNPETPPYDEWALVIDESRETLAEHWFRRFDPDMWEMAWAENPPVRYRHFISNVRVRHTGSANVYDVRSNVIVTATRQSDRPSALYVERFDRLTREGGELLLQERVVVSESTVIEFAQLRVIL
jgi:3-phenylpropionate/cinnamic acid dioxygenase small subunit